MARASTNDTVLGIVLLVLGILLLVDVFDIPFLGTIIGVVLIVLGILALMGAGGMRKNQLLGLVLVVLGVLVLLPLGISGALAGLVETIVAVVLIVAGILKLVGKW